MRSCINGSLWFCGHYAAGFDHEILHFPYHIVVAYENRAEMVV